MWLDAAGFKGHIAAVTDEEVEPADADHETEHQEPRVRWGVVASVLLHVPVVALLIFGLPDIQLTPTEDESVKVELVPPPEEKKPDEKPKEEEKPQEQAKAEPPPPPPSSPPPSPAPQTRVGGSAPVFAFGDKSSGPAKSVNGNASEGEKDDTPLPPPPSVPQPLEEQAVDVANKRPPSEQPSGSPVPQDVKLPEVAATDVHSERDMPAASTPEEVNTSFEPEKLAESKKTVPQKDQVSKAPLPEVKRLFSQNTTDDQIAQTAMGNMPRGERMNQLCRTELNQQIIHEDPKYQGADLPVYPLTNETAIEVRKGAFFKDGKWYNVQFRCEVDADAKKILSFGFKFGGMIPRSEYPNFNLRR
ncbi:hypothetical protein FHX15_000463 [Rhizobium sp. BK650]|uniref:DUF930 domain-containing protein n=1 Tax=Rhizobium sp. BK650 TaxID=2586990 RepID=UPI00160A8DE7|nr:DUF930 domain-containing protein [Rhizobium sp. BK650]MBB3655264.1 hypothetical protein [Rhizobium sp. BK650]